MNEARVTRGQIKIHMKKSNQSWPSSIKPTRMKKKKLLIINVQGYSPRDSEPKRPMAYETDMLVWDRHVSLMDLMATFLRVHQTDTFSTVACPSHGQLVCWDVRKIYMGYDSPFKVSSKNYSYDVGIKGFP